MIRDREAYQRHRAADEQRALEDLSAADSLAIGAALWTSSFAAGLEIPAEPRGLNLARQLGIAGDRRTSQRPGPRP